MRIAAFAIVLLALGCHAGAQSPPTKDYAYRPPEQLDDGWPVSSLEAEGMDEAAVARVTNLIQGGRFEGIHSLLIVKNGRLVHEVYFGKYHRDSLNTAYSITKNVSSALIGIAVDLGLISGVDEPVLWLLPEYKSAIKDPRKHRITLANILTHTSGLEWDEWSTSYDDTQNSEWRMIDTRDWQKFVLTRRLRSDPGTRFVYNTGAIHLLSAILEEQTGLPANAFAERHLFEPLGIERYEWNKDPQGHVCTGGTDGGVRLRARDLLKFGSVFMSEGRWHGKQVISKEWVKKSTRKRIDVDRARAMGYTWWRSTFTIDGRSIPQIYASGYGGQHLALVSDLDLMFLITSWGREKGADILGPMVAVLRAALPRQPSSDAEYFGG